MMELKKAYIKNKDFGKFYDFCDSTKFRAGEYVPTKAELKKMLDNIQEYILFLMWIDDTGEVTSENEDEHLIISKILKECLEIV